MPVEMELRELEAEVLLEEVESERLSRAPRRRAHAAVALAAGLAAAAALALVGRHSGAQAAASRDVVGLAVTAKACTAGRGNCNETQCCSDPGMQCYEQDALYSQCRETCSHSGAPDPTHWDGKDWTCKALGDRKAGENKCVDAWQECSSSKCCKDPEHTCFEKEPGHAACMPECTAGGPILSDGDSKPWSCKKLGETTPSTQPWVAGQCSKGLDNCINKGRCCQIPGQQCFLQNDYYGNCLTACVGVADGDPWSCKAKGIKTPAAPIKGGKLAKWVTEECKLEGGDDCSKSKCCIGMNVQCYEKNKNWAQCKQSCTPGRDLADKNETWSCKPLGPRSLGLATKGFPSLYCFILTRTDGYEVGLIKAMLAKGAGVFDCDEYDLLTADGKLTLDGPKGSVTSIQFPGAPVVTSQDGTAGNSQLFVHAWDAVIAAQKWKNHTFIVKADPDAVVIPTRLRWHLASHAGEHVFILNCNKFPGPNYPMVYGALEVYANSAIQAWADRGHDCYAPNTYGEDYYMTRCMDHLGVGRVLDEQVLGDNLCMGADCANGWTAAFHPYKDVASWEKCYNTAMGTPM